MKKTVSLIFLIICFVLVHGQNRFDDFNAFNSWSKKVESSDQLSEKNLALIVENYQKKNVRFLNVIANDDLPGDKVEIILEAHDLWGNSNLGYHMLLDDTHTAYGEQFDPEISVMYAMWGYKGFSHTIPEGITNTDGPILCDGLESIIIPAGTYDYIIGMPISMEKELQYAKGPFSLADNFEFKGGNTYHFKLDWLEIDGFNKDYVFLEVPVDASLEELNLPVNGLNLGAAETISVKIKNNGIAAISNFELTYQINEGNVVKEIFTATIEPKATANYTFTKKADFSVEGSYTVKANINLPGDIIEINNELIAKCRHIGLKKVPFFYDFSSQEDFEGEWTIVNRDENFSKWVYSFSEWILSPDGSPGLVSCTGNWQGLNDDFLITPVFELNKGTHNVSFYLKCVNEENTETIAVLLGKETDDLEDYVKLGEYQVNHTFWKLKFADFEVKEKGNYKFAFQDISDDGQNLYLDEIAIEEGAFVTSPMISLEKVLIPYSGCHFSDQSVIGARITNNGTGATSSLTLSYTVNDQSQVTETVEVAIAPDETADVYFKTTSDMSALGSYTVTIKAKAGDIEDTKTAQTTHYEPLDKFPFETNFQLNQDVTDYWTPMTEGVWSFDPMGGYWGTEKTGIDNGLLLRCLTLNRSFRIRIAYRGGGAFGFTPSSISIAYGKAGTDINTWEKIYENTNVTSVVDIEFKTKLKEPGDYGFIISSGGEESLGVFYFNLSEVYDYDIRPLQTDFPIAAYMPAKQIPFEGNYNVLLENRGEKSSTGIKASIYLGDQELSVSESTINLAPDKKASLQLKASLPQAQVGDELKLRSKVTQVEEDEFPEDNFMDLPTIHVTESVLAMEGISDFTTAQGMGMNGGKIYFGNVYTLMNPDVLTSISVGLAYNEYYQYETMGVAVYKMKDDENIDYELFSTELERGEGGELKEIAIDPIMLQPGKYYFEVRQLEMMNIGLAFKEEPALVCYQNINNVLVPNRGGVLSIRGNFKLNAQAPIKDAQAVQLIDPFFHQAIFSSEEKLVASFRNQGSESVTDMEVVCEANGVKHTAKVSLRPYETKEVSFIVDLSTPGEYTIQLYPQLEGDENPQNDKITYQLTSQAIANPYVLDFELCNDFATANEFNPLWWTIDRNDHKEVNSWTFFNFRNAGKPVGFIAYNREATTPAMGEEDIPGFVPRSGKRFGIAFGPAFGYDKESDIWLVSPKLKLAKESSMELYVKSAEEPRFGSELERFNILISTTNDDFDSFQVIGEERRAPWEDWGKVEVDLNAYNNQEVYLAIQYVSRVIQGVVLMVDDIEIKTQGLGLDNLREDVSMNLYYSVPERMLVVKSETAIQRIALHNLTGQLIYQSGALYTNNYRLSVAAYPAGVYLATVYTEEGMKTIKFILNR